MLIFEWIKTHIRITLVIFAIIFLVLFLGFTIFKAIQSRFFNPQNSQSNTTSEPQAVSGQANIKIQTGKNTFAAGEKIPLSVIANSDNQPVRAFDIVFEYDPEILTLTQMKAEKLADFTYFGKNSEKIIRISAVQKPDSTGDQIFKDTNILDLEFQAVKAGKTQFKIFYSPNSTSDSNLLNKTSEDILSEARGASIEIK